MIGYVYLEGGVFPKGGEYDPNSAETEDFSFSSESFSRRRTNNSNLFNTNSTPSWADDWRKPADCNSTVNTLWFAAGYFIEILDEKISHFLRLFFVNNSAGRLTQIKLHGLIEQSVEA